MAAVLSTAAVPALGSPSCTRQRTASGAGSGSGLTPVWAASPRKTGQSAAGPAAARANSAQAARRVVGMSVPSLQLATQVGPAAAQALEHVATLGPVHQVRGLIRVGVQVVQLLDRRPLGDPAQVFPA